MKKAKSVPIKSASSEPKQNFIVRRLKPILERRTRAKSHSGSGSLQDTDWDSDVLTPEYLKDEVPDYVEVDFGPPVEEDPVTAMDKPKREPVAAEHASLQERYTQIMAQEET